jgi:hypothetical protein
VRQITTRKAQGAENIPVETLKRYIETSVKLLHLLFADIWDMVEVADDWKEGLISNTAKESWHLKISSLERHNITLYTK